MRASPFVIGVSSTLICSSFAVAAIDCEQDAFRRHASSEKLDFDSFKRMSRDPKYQACLRQGAPNARAQAAPKPAGAQPLYADPLPLGPKNGQTIFDPLSKTASSMYVFLRKDFTDVFAFGALPGVAEAEGATFQYSDNRQGRNAIWSAQGVTGFVWTHYSTGPQGNKEDGLIGVTFAPYVEFDVSRNSNPERASRDRENFVIGASAEAAFNLWGGQQYWRVRGGSNIDNITQTKSATAVFEWIPAYDLVGPLSIGLTRGVLARDNPSESVFRYMVYRLSPEFKARYDTIPIADGSNITRDETRLGGQVSLFYGFLSSKLFPVPDLLSRLSGTTTYSWLQSTTSGRTFEWFETSVSFRLDDDGFVALKGAFKKGRNEQTAVLTDEYSLGLAAKW